MASTFERVVEILKDQGFDNIEVTPDMTLAQIGLDSLDTVEVVMACEDAFNIEIDPDANPATVAEFVELIDKTVG